LIDMMKNIILLIIGVLLLVFVMISPLPAIFAIPGVAWRIMIGLLGCFLTVLGIYKTAHAFRKK